MKLEYYEEESTYWNGPVRLCCWNCLNDSTPHTCNDKKSNHGYCNRYIYDM